MNSARAARARGFTLIELLVVISIISVLASMLMPAYSRARESARKIVCTSNLKQISMAINMYVQDHDYCYPVAYPFWSGSYMGPNGSPLPSEPNLKTCVQSYVRNDEVWWCPSWAGVYGRNAWGNANGGSIDFIIPSPQTQEIIGGPATSPTPSYWSEAALQEPAAYPLLFCGSPFGGNGTLNAHSGANDSSFFNGKSLGGTNIAYADGHVKWVPLDKGKWDALYQTRR